MKKPLFNRIYKRFEPIFPTAEEKSPCPSCGGSMRHRINEDCSVSAEAKFGCIKCKYTEFRGGTGSEIWLEHIYQVRQKNIFLRKLYFS